MEKNQIKNLPTWYNDKTNKYHTILTDDIDSLLSCAILKQVMGWNIEEVFLLKQVANYSDIPIDVSAKTKHATVTEEIGVDFAKYKGKCFDNHITRFSNKDYKNEESINPNLMEDVTKKNYTEKYAGSTVLLLWSLYGLSKDMTDEAMMILLTIDSSFLGYYDDRYRPYIKHYLVDVLDLPEFYNCIERHTQEDFKRIKNKYHLSGKIRLENGHLKTNIDIDKINEVLLWETAEVLEIELPTEEFYVDKFFMSEIEDIYGLYAECDRDIIQKEQYCHALTRTNTVNYSIEIKEKDEVE